MAGQSIYQQGDRWTLSVNVHIQAPLTPHTASPASITPLLPVDRVTAASCRMMSCRDQLEEFWMHGSPFRRPRKLGHS